MSFDFTAVSAPFRMQPGMRRLAPGDRQLTPNSPGDRAFNEKLAVLRRHPQQALLVSDSFDARPALHALAAHAATEHVGAFSIDAAGNWNARHLGWALHGDDVRGSGEPAIGECLRRIPSQWRHAGLLALTFAEDFAVIDAATGRIPWLAVCLPSNWSPEEKVGRHFAEVHAPVADNAMLIMAGQHLMRLVTGNDRWERFVWTISRQETLGQHPQRDNAGPWPPELDADALAARAFFRTERQTFIPVPGRAQAVFTIHVENDPLVQVIDSAARARQVHAALASMSPAVLAYRGLGTARDRLLHWLEARVLSDR